MISPTIGEEHFNTSEGPRIIDRVIHLKVIELPRPQNYCKFLSLDWVAPNANLLRQIVLEE